MIAAKYDNFLSVKSLSSHGLNHLPGYNRSLPYQRIKRDQHGAGTKINQQQITEVPSRAVGKISDNYSSMVIPRIPSNNVVIKDDSVVVTSAKSPEFKGNTSLDDQILYHKLEITKLEHLKSITVNRV